jgi:hypothetical protein
MKPLLRPARLAHLSRFSDAAVGNKQRRSSLQFQIGDNELK